jgi:hypothetical protein
MDQETEFKQNAKPIRSLADILNFIGETTVTSKFGLHAYAFILALAFIYIQNRTENRSRQMQALEKKIIELNWEFKDQSRKLMFITKQSEIEVSAQRLGLVQNITPPHRILIKAD